MVPCYLVDLHSSDNPDDLDQVCQRGLWGQADGSVQGFTHEVGMVRDGAVEGPTADGAGLVHFRFRKIGKVCPIHSQQCRAEHRVQDIGQREGGLRMGDPTLFPPDDHVHLSWKRWKKSNQRGTRGGIWSQDGVWRFYTAADWSNLWGRRGRGYLVWTPWLWCSGKTWTPTWKRHTLIHWRRKQMKAKSQFIHSGSVPAGSVFLWNKIFLTLSMRNQNVKSWFLQAVVLCFRYLNWRLLPKKLGNYWEIYKPARARTQRK